MHTFPYDFNTNIVTLYVHCTYIFEMDRFIHNCKKEREKKRTKRKRNRDKDKKESKRIMTK